MSKRVYVDLEYCYPGMTAQSGRPGEDDLRQIIQIAAITYDHSTGEELRSFDILVSPAYTKVLPRFFVELTGITQEQVDEEAVTFPEGLEKFVKFCDGLEIYTFDRDWHVLKQNCSYFDIGFPFEKTPFLRIKENLKEWGVPDDAYSSGSLHEAAGLVMGGHVHNALHDVRSMAAATHWFEQNHA